MYTMIKVIKRRISTARAVGFSWSECLARSLAVWSCPFAAKTLLASLVTAVDGINESTMSLDILTLDLQIERLREGNTLSEHEVNALCDKVSWFEGANVCCGMSANLCCQTRGCWFARALSSRSTATMTYLFVLFCNVALMPSLFSLVYAHCLPHYSYADLLDTNSSLGKGNPSARVQCPACSRSCDGLR